MNKILFTTFLAMAISFPVFAANSTVSNKKNDIEMKYSIKKYSENQSYYTKVADAKLSYLNDPNDKLINILKELEIEHNNKIDELNCKERMDLQVFDEAHNI